ncbi:MAG TPA: DUF1257 domain-containing protein [bacterium]|jgi:hypothetical protein
MSGAFFMPPIPIPMMEVPTALLALGLIGFEIVHGTNSLLCKKQSQVVDHVLVNESGLRIGIRTTQEGKIELLVDEEELREKEGLELNDFQEQVQKQYGYVQLVNRLKSEGYEVVEETEETDETVRLVVRRWR